MRIETLTPALAEKYEAFILARPETLLYQSWAYQCLLEELLGCRQQGLLVLDDDDELLAALPLMAMDGCYGTVLNSLPYYGSNGGLIGDDSTALKALIGAYEDMTKQPTIAAATLIENPLAPLDVAYGYQLLDERIGQLTPLPADENVAKALMDSFHYKTRNMVRKAEKNGVRVSVKNDALPFLINVHEENMKEIGGMAKPRRFFQTIVDHFKVDVDYCVYLAHQETEPVAALLVFYYNNTVEYYTPVVRKEYRDTQALSAIIFQAMCDAAQSGYNWWNWGGTWISQEGVYRFKSRWGTKDKPYRYFTSVNNSALLKSNPGDLLAAYPHFYTVPFSALTHEQEGHHAGN
ncbi:peptidoglycan bridge formation glycyltransferase FemA/FemB family protein [Gammaproteobacteria bacterium]|nr:peptidoglycan bridge formation glycyltransferase FemA/FemB family protein [Gammaproteobacteria bacterium]